MREVPIPARAFVIRYPNGDFEYDLSRNDIPAIGETLRRQGSLWWVARINEEDVLTVYVRSVDPELTRETSERAQLDDTP